MTHFSQGHSIVLETNHADRYVCLTHYIHVVISHARTPRNMHSELPGLTF